MTAHEIEIKRTGRGGPFRNARCSCGWRSQWNRRTEADARRDGEEHLAEVAP
jgi:hypothetical protein